MSKKLVTDVGGEIRSLIVKGTAAGILGLVAWIALQAYQLATGNTQAFYFIAILSLGLISIGLVTSIWKLKAKTKMDREVCKGGDIFWLCSDTHQAMGMVSSDSMIQIIDALERVHHHATQIGLVLDRQKIDRLWSLRNEAIGAVNHEWSSNKRDSVWQELKSFLDDASQEIQRKQEDFIPNPKVQYKP